MTARGRAAALPPPGWQPPSRRQGMRVLFVSEDGRQRKNFDFTSLAGHDQVRDELVEAFSEATGPLSPYRRLGSANALLTTVRRTAEWIAHNRPSMTGLAEFSVADTRMLLNAMRAPNGSLPLTTIRTLFSNCPTVSEAVIGELARPTANRQDGEARQPYTEQEWRWISSALRGIIRRARTRITTHHMLVADYRAGRLDNDSSAIDGGLRGEPDGDLLARRRDLAEVLDHYLRTGKTPLTEAGFPSSAQRRAGVGLGRGRSTKSMVTLTAGEAWAFGALLVGLTGMNGSTVFELPVPDLRATSPTEPGIVFADATKHRRGAMAAMTIPLTALPSELHPPGSDRRPQRVLDTSLTTGFGVFMLLVQLTAPARALLGSPMAFVFHNGCSPHPSLSDGAPINAVSTRQAWLREMLSGDRERDEVLLGLHMNRLRRTFLERGRRPVAHTPATFTRYLRGMTTVRHESFQIIREALDEQVDHALARRAMTVDTAEPTQPVGHDTVLGACIDFQHSPQDGGRACRQTFLTCLDCSNARAFPRHLPFQLAVLDLLNERRDQVSVQQWTTDLAGRAAQLHQIIEEFEPAQRTQARSHITDEHRRLAVRLLAGDLDPS